MKKPMLTTLIALAAALALSLSLVLTAGAYGEFPGDILYVRATDTTDVYSVASTDTGKTGAEACAEVGLSWTGKGGVVGNRVIVTCTGSYSGPLK